MRRWPPAIWLAMYVASELILLGSNHRWGLLAAGGALALGAFALSLWMSLAGGEQGPRPRAAGALAAGVIPLTGVSLLLATVRAKTVQTDSGLRDASGAREDPYPGIGLDDATPLGDTSEHSEVQEDPGPPPRFAPPPRRRLTRPRTGEVRHSPTQRRSSR